MATAVKKTAKNGIAKPKQQTETPLKLTKKQREFLETQENAVKIISQLHREGKIKPYKKSY